MRRNPFGCRTDATHVDERVDEEYPPGSALASDTGSDADDFLMTAFFLTSRHGERYLHDVNRDTFERNPSADVFERRFDTDFGAADTLFLIVGTDSGLLPRWLAQVPSGPGSRRLFIELDEYHETIAESLGTLAPADVDLSRASAWQDRLDTIDPSRWLYAGKLVVVGSAGCDAGFAVGYGPLLREIRARIGELVHAATAGIDHRLFIETQLRNVADNRTPARSIGRIGEGRTAIVLGGGPSLDEHLDWIGTRRTQLFVIAASRLVGKLASHGIEPDAIMAVDPQDMLFDISKEGMTLDRTVLVSAYHVCAPLLQQWRGPTLYTGCALPWTSEASDDEDNIASMGSTVSHNALWLAYEWGFSQILLSGVDLCFAPGGATHASGSIESLCTALPCRYERQLETYSGRRAGTSTILKAGRDELETIGATLAAAGIRVINLAGEAARIDSIRQIDMEAVELDGTRPQLDIPADPASSAVPRLRRLTKELEAARSGLHAIRQACTDARRCLDGLHGTTGRPADYRFKRKLDAVERRLQGRLGRWMKPVVHYAAGDMIRSVSPRDFTALSEAELERWGRDYYHDIDRYAQRYATLVADALERIRYRLLEATPAGSALSLIDYWRRDGTLGRIETVFGAHRDDLSMQESEAIAMAWHEYEDSLHSTDSAFEQRHTARKENAASVLQTIALLVGENDHDDLLRLTDGLASMDSSWAPIAQWAAGRLAELREAHETALEHYREVVELHADMQECGGSPLPGSDRLLEDVLLRIVHLQLSQGEGEAALQGLSILAGLSPAYTPRLSSLLALLGRRDDAIALLQGTISAGHGDWRIAIQMADLYTAAGATDAAAVAHDLAQRMREHAVAPGDEHLAA